MSLKSYILNLPSEVLGIIADYCGVLSLHELFKIGNRILTSKLVAPSGVSRYTNLNEFEQQTEWSASLLNKFRGLRKLELFSDDSALQGSDRLLESLSTTLEELSLHAYNSEDIWYSIEGKGKKNGFNFAIRCPRLKTLSLLDSRTPHYVDGLPGTEWLKDHALLFPSTLTCLRLDVALELESTLISYLPTQLEELSLHVLRVEGIEWLFRFPHLQVLGLKRSFEADWTFSDSELDESAIERNKKSPTNIRKFWTDFERRKPFGFFSYLTNVEALDVPNLSQVLKGIEGLLKLKSLTCLIPTPGDLQSISAANPLFPPTVTALSLVQSYMWPHAPSDQWMVRLPQNLRRFHYEGPSSVEDLPLLPRTLTHLVFTVPFYMPPGGHMTEDDIFAWVASMPPTLTTLRLPFASKDGSIFLDQSRSLKELQPLLQQSRLNPFRPWHHVACALASPQGIPTIETFLHEYGHSQFMDILFTMLLSRGFEGPLKTDFHPHVFHWLRMRGVLSTPAAAGIVNAQDLIGLAIKARQTEFLLLILPYCPPHDWIDIAPEYAELARNEFVPVLEWLYENGYEFHDVDTDTKSSPFIKAAHKRKQRLALDWFKKRYGTASSVPK